MTSSQKFTVRGVRNGSQVHVTWSDGKLTGDPPTVDFVELEAEMAGLYPDDPNSMASQFYGEADMSGDPLADAASAWRLIESVLDSVTTVEGDAPPDAIERPR